MSSPKPAPASPLPKSARTVTVASKIPMTIELQLCRQETKSVTGRYGTEKETVNVKHGKTYFIRGTARPNGTIPKGYPKAPDMADGAALTPGVPAEFFEEWLAQNAETDMVLNHMVFAHSSRDHVEGIAADHREELSGLDPINPEQNKDGSMVDRRVPKPIDANVGGIQTAERPAA